MMSEPNVSARLQVEVGLRSAEAPADVLRSTAGSLPGEERVANAEEQG